ncbi:MAG: Panacea domain-containing protein, partial [Pseudanabaena sp.]
MATVQDTVITHDIANVNTKATAYDVAAYIVDKQVSTTGSGIPAMKLQKLVYYAQAWSLVWDDKPLFSDRIEAWANGPVVPDLYESLYGQFMIVGVNKGNLDVFTDVERETIDSVLKYYG